MPTAVTGGVGTYWSMVRAYAHALINRQSICIAHARDRTIKLNFCYLHIHIRKKLGDVKTATEFDNITL